MANPAAKESPIGEGGIRGGCGGRREAAAELPLDSRYVPTDQQRREVLMLTGYGARQSEIATLLDIAPKTLRKAFRRELDIGAIEANARVSAALYMPPSSTMSPRKSGG